MEKQNQNLNAQKKPYDAPKAVFIPLKIEEKLLSCGKDSEWCGISGGLTLILHLGVACSGGHQMS